MKCVILLDESLAIGTLANCASVLSLSLGKKVEGILGYELKDKQNRKHEAITTIPVPILKSNPEQLKTLREKLFEEKYQSCFVVDVTTASKHAHHYDEYATHMKESEVLEYMGLSIYGPKKLVNSLVGSIGLLR